MLDDRSTTAVLTAPANAGLTAFQVAVVQQKVFEKTLQEVSEKQELAAEVQARKSEAQRQRIRERIADLRGGVDVVVDDSPSEKASGASEDSPSSREVDIKV